MPTIQAFMAACCMPLKCRIQGELNSQMPRTTLTQSSHCATCASATTETTATITPTIQAFHAGSGVPLNPRIQGETNSQTARISVSQLGQRYDAGAELFDIVNSFQRPDTPL